MKKTVFVLFILICSSVIAQDKKILKIEQLYQSGAYDKCLENIDKYLEKNSKQPEPLYFGTLCNFEKYKSEFKKKDKYMRDAVKYAGKAVIYDKDKLLFSKFENQMNQFHDSLLAFSLTIYKSNLKENSKYFYEQIAKIFNDTTPQYREFFSPPIEDNNKGLQDNKYTGPINQKDLKGEKQGLWLGKYFDGKLKYEVTYQDGKPVGEYIRYYQSGKRKSIMFFDENSKKTPIVFFNENGNKIALGYYIDKQKDSTWYYFKNDSILMIIENYKNGLKEGIEKKFYEHGAVIEERTYKNGKEHGTRTQYHPNGNIWTQVTLKDGKLDGPYIKNYSSGALNVKGGYKNDVKHGKWITYDIDGKIIEMEYVNGKLKNEDKLNEEQRLLFKKYEEKRNQFIDPADYQNNPDEFLRMQGGWD